MMEFPSLVLYTIKRKYPFSLSPFFLNSYNIKMKAAIVTGYHLAGVSKNSSLWTWFIGWLLNVPATC